MALAGTTWLINENIISASFSALTSFSGSFVSNNTSFSTFVVTTGKECALKYDSTKVWSEYSPYWVNEAYRTIHFDTVTAGESAVESWLNTYAENITPEPVDYLTTDVEITSIADAIRAKGGTSAQLVYPAGFVSAIGAITTPYPSADGVSFGTVMIDFMIVSRTNQAESGMTWEQWISSAYNVYGYVLNGNYISSVPSQGNLAYNGTDEVKTNTIVENRVYTWHLPK